MIYKANKNRAVATTNCNEHSSRSHLIFKIRLLAENPERKRRERSLTLVDLAGSERVGESKVEGDRLKETQSINKSLSQLGVVLSSIKNKEQHIPFRSSKLTHQLQKCLEGDARALMIINVSPEIQDYQQSLISLRFAEGVRECKLKK